MSYESWIAARSEIAPTAGLDVSQNDLQSMLFPFQRDIVSWALGRGRAAVFADTGLGKTPMQLEWARVVADREGPVLILAPLAVAEQTVREAGKFGIAGVGYRREHDHGLPITVANYEMLDHFDADSFAGIVLDESSILKSYTGHTRNEIIRAFARTPYRLACTATPAPNDHMELGNHSEFLGILNRTEMLAQFFVHDGAKTQAWRLKGHARDPFWRWVCSWAAMVRRPSDLGYDDDGFDLPPLDDGTIAIQSDIEDAWRAGVLLPVAVATLSDQRAARKATMAKRIAAIAAAIAVEPDEPALVWCEMNAEGDALESAIPDAVQVRGADSADDKRDRLLAFADGGLRVLVTKPSIAGFGMNWQHCARMYFVGATHSYEQRYQAIRRCWRYGQTRPVIVRTCVADTEGAVLQNLRRKHSDAETMQAEMARHIMTAGMQHGRGADREWIEYAAGERMELPSWIRDVSSRTTATTTRCTEEIASSSSAGCQTTA